MWLTQILKGIKIDHISREGNPYRASKISLVNNDLLFSMLVTFLKIVKSDRQVMPINHRRWILYNTIKDYCLPI